MRLLLCSTAVVVLSFRFSHGAYRLVTLPRCQEGFTGSDEIEVGDIVDSVVVSNLALA